VAVEYLRSCLILSRWLIVEKVVFQRYEAYLSFQIHELIKVVVQQVVLVLFFQLCELVRLLHTNRVDIQLHAEASAFQD